MARKRSDRRESFQGLWPWPGNIFLVLFGAWAFYMGHLAEARDVQLAFYGLCGVTAFVLLLGLRSIGRKAATAEERPAMRTVPRSEEVSFSPRERMPQNSAMRTESASAGRSSPSPFPESRPFGPSLDALINREKAARGAQIAKLETTLNERLGLLEERLGEGGGAAGGKSPLDEYLRIETFNSAINERLLPRIKEMIGAVVDERMASAQAPRGLADDLAKLRSAREVDQRDMKELRSAIEAAQGADGAGSALDTAAITARVQTVERAVEARKEELERLSTTVRDTVTDMGRHLKRVDEVTADIVRRLDRIGADAGDGERTPADVSQLRDALATIIEQNRDIKERQEMLSARFEVPVGGQKAQ